MEEELLPAPVTNPKSVNHYVSMKHQFDTAKLRDLLREKCRIRVKENRESNFDITRDFLRTEKDWLIDCLKLVDDNLLLEEIIREELIEESYQWLLDHYDRELDYLASKDPKVVAAICPICQVSELKSIDQTLQCTCGARFAYQHSLEHFCAQMQHIVAVHETQCSSTLLFFLEPNPLGQITLTAMCDKCDYINSIGN